MTAQLEAPVTRAARAEDLADQRVVLFNVTWPDYEAIGEALRDRSNVRLTFDEGTLEIMTTSCTHEWFKSVSGRLVETLAEEFGFPLRPGGSMTFKRRALQRGLEPDECFWIASEPQLRGRLTWSLEDGPPPDLVVEVEVTRSALPRMKIFAALGVPEIWRFDGTSLGVYRLGDDGAYHPVGGSPTFPGIAIAQLPQFLQPNEAMDYLQTMREFRLWVRAQLDEATDGE